MSLCIYKVNATGKLFYDVESKFPNGSRDGYTVLECGLKTQKDAQERIEEILAEQAAEQADKKS